MRVDEALKVFGFTVGKEVNENELTARFRALANEYHPDKGGDVRMMQLLLDARETLQKALAEGADWFASTNCVEADIIQEFKEILEALKNVPNIEVELCGSWLWIEASKAVKDALKELGCKWAGKKKKWYWHLPNTTSRKWKKRKEWRMDEIRSKFGTQTVLKTKGRTALQ
jgi:hypothetical protein